MEGILSVNSIYRIEMCLGELLEYGFEWLEYLWIFLDSLVLEVGWGYWFFDCFSWCVLCLLFKVWEDLVWLGIKVIDFE